MTLLTVSSLLSGIAGPIGGDLSHEFLVLAETGESELYCDPAVLSLDTMLKDVDYNGDLEPIVRRYTDYYAATDEKYDTQDPVVQELGDKMLKTRGIEVGHIFLFGTKYSEPLKAHVMDETGRQVPVFMGSYGVGVSRLLGAIIEASHDDKGIIWPEDVAPFRVGVINLKSDDHDCCTVAQDLHDSLEAAGCSCLLDDRAERAGVKFNDMDLIGIPWQITVGPRGLQNGTLELKCRKTGEKQDLSIEAVKQRFCS